MPSTYSHYYAQGVKLASEFTRLLWNIGAPTAVGAVGGAMYADDPWHGAAMGALIGGAGGLGREVAARRVLSGNLYKEQQPVRNMFSDARKNLYDIPRDLQAVGHIGTPSALGKAGYQNSLHNLNASRHMVNSMEELERLHHNNMLRDAQFQGGATGLAVGATTAGGLDSMYGDK